MTPAQQTARILLETESILIRPEEPFTLTSGKQSPVYVDCRKLISFPRARRRLIELMAEQVYRQIGFESLDAVAGGETAGIPYAAWLAETLNLPMLYIRKKPKGFGRNAQIEGTAPEGARVLLVEDLATDGGSKVVFVNAMREAGLVVSDTSVVFHYGIFPYEQSALYQLDVNLHGLATWHDVLALLESEKTLGHQQLNSIKLFLNDPEKWQKNNQTGD